MYLLYFTFFATAILAECTSQPISPADYQGIIGQGFTTNWFKSPSPAKNYRTQNIQDIYNRGFRNVRLRSRADLYTAPYNDARFTWFLTNLTAVVDECVEVGVAPIISWIHHNAEAYATEEDRHNYVTWWTKVAEALKDKSYNLSFNLINELGVDQCRSDNLPCDESLRRRPDKYNNWTAEVVSAIRTTGGNNAKRILILASPEKTAEGLVKIDEKIYESDSYMMVEWHTYAAGPHKKLIKKGKDYGPRYWIGNGTLIGRKKVRDAIKPAKEFTNSTGLLSYFGAWMPTDNKRGSLNETEVINFARFFVNELKNEQIPWSLNVLDRYYDTRESQWLTGTQNIQGAQIDMSLVLENILDVM